MLALRPSQRRGDCGRVAVGLCGALPGAEATRVDRVGTALEDLLDTCPRALGRRLRVLCDSALDAWGTAAVERLWRCWSSTLSVSGECKKEKPRKVGKFAMVNQ